VVAAVAAVAVGVDCLLFGCCGCCGCLVDVVVWLAGRFACFFSPFFFLFVLAPVLDFVRRGGSFRVFLFFVVNNN